MKKYKPLIKVANYLGQPKKYIVYDENTMHPLSGVAGQSRSTAYRIAKRLKSATI